MKLYATTTSERASKGQGGNEYIETIYNVGETPTYSVTLYPDGSIVLLDIKSEDYLFRKDISGTWENIIKTTKGEKKKGDSCKYCGITHTKYELCPLDIPR